MGIVITAIKVGNLSSHNVTSLVAEALGMEDDEKYVQTLAATVHKKTEGNAFFMLVSKGDFMCWLAHRTKAHPRYIYITFNHSLMFLRSLYDEELIKFNFGTMRWRWDDNQVEAKL